MKAAKLLKREGEKFKNIYINFDQTPSQREQRNLLITQRKEKNAHLLQDLPSKICVIRNNSLRIVDRIASQ